ncbi:hypothetical protein OG874_22635 [Nocardia sp. NBC_00565]|uniref:hypothetical protein n=1 Tax=Nocardia sp. NBC_00565 TaxID=2975993 RepID=UPI002E801A19|nr:hypothetical protein [Nocardia sp. NBC_00565]WUC07715.1 hypothetical protein OG874_22635 [Nocardia sp. NBC_00565]
MFGVVVLFVIPMTIGAVATAQTQTDSAGSSTIDAIGWMGVRDSSGVPLANYVFVTNHGSFLHPGYVPLSTVLELEFAGIMATEASGIAVVLFVVSFRWLDLVAQPLSRVADAFSGQVATPIVITLAATIGGGSVAWFALQQYFSKVTLQVVAMLLVAVFGVPYLAHPMADVLSPDGLLAQGRDVGVAVAAGLNGQSNPDPRVVVDSIEGTLADNFVRYPLQVWNFGHVVDESPACRAAWSAGVLAGSADKVASGMKRCGDIAAYTKADNPNAGQICTGLLLLVFAAVLLMFGVYLSGKIVLAAAEAIYHAFMAIFGFAAGGFIYGPSQTFLARNLVDAFVSAGKMIAFTVYLGLYALILGDVFKQAQGHGIAVIFIGGSIMIIGIVLLRRMSRSLAAAPSRIAGQISAVLASGHVAQTGGGGGGGPMMGPGGNMSGTQRLVTTLAALNTVNASPVTEYLMGRRRSPLSSRSRLRQEAEVANMEQAVEAGRFGWIRNYYRTREQIIDSARSAAASYGHTPMGAAVAVDRVIDRGASLGDAEAALFSAGFTDKEMRTNAIKAYNYRTSWGPNMWDGDKHIGQAIASLGVLKLGRTPANVALFQRTAHRLAERRFADPDLHFSSFTAPEQQFLREYFNNPTEPVIHAIRDVVSGTGNSLPNLTGTVSRDRAALMNRFINVHLSREYLAAANAEDFATASGILQKMALPEYWTGSSTLTPAKAIPTF